MKTEQEIRDALKRCHRNMASWFTGDCWRYGGRCCAEECSTISTLAWMLGKKVDSESEDFPEK